MLHVGISRHDGPDTSDSIQETISERFSSATKKIDERVAPQTFKCEDAVGP